MSRPRLLDLYAGAGGAARGYRLAGFHVTGVDHVAQPRYAGDAFVQADALAYLAEHGHGYDAVHASPPCQAFTQMAARWRGKGTKADAHADLLTPTRAALAGDPRPWVIENVQGAKHRMSTSLRLHGGMFGLTMLHRPRLFESNVLIPTPYGKRTQSPIGVYGEKPNGRWTYRYRNNGNDEGKSVIRAAKSIEEAQAAMGIDWMTWEEIREAIPPAYTAHIGRWLIAALEAVA